MRKKIFATCQNFILVQERKSRRGINAPCVIRSSGYTSTVKGVLDPWIWTQFQTIPHLDRSNLPDPGIIQKLPSMYEELDCNVLLFYFLPACAGIKYAMEEFAQFLEETIFPIYEKHALIGHSKGGLLMAGLTNYLNTLTNIAMITPTFGTIMGSKEMISEKLDKYLEKQVSPIKRLLATPEVNIYRHITNRFGSGRPIDRDMSINSDFLCNDLDLSKLDNHHTLLITATCPQENCTFLESSFRHFAKLVGLASDADGMVSLSNQEIPAELVDKIISIEATHPTALGCSENYLKDFISQI